MRFRFLGFKRERPVFQVFLDEGEELSLIKELFRKARLCIRVAVNSLGYTLEEINRKPLERLPLDRRIKRNSVLRLARRIFGRYIIYTTDEKSNYYKLGLALTDGYIRSNVSFETTRYDLSFCIFKAWQKVTVRLGRGFYVKNNNLYPSLELTCSRVEKEFLWKLQGKNISRYELYEFIAGIIDGDGTVDKKVVKICYSDKKLSTALRIKSMP